MHDSYGRFHRDQFLENVPPAGRLTLDIGCGEGRLSRDLEALGHAVIGIDASATMVRNAREADGSYLERFRYEDHLERDGLNVTFASEHRPLAAYFEALAAAGFVVERLREPALPDAALRGPRHRCWQRVPMFLHIRAVRSSPAEA